MKIPKRKVFKVLQPSKLAHGGRAYCFWLQQMVYKPGLREAIMV